jgi:hypothetical protein
VRGRLGGISADGRYFSFGVDLPALVRDLERGVTTPLAPQAAYLGASPSISGDGAWVAFTATVGGILQSYACPRTDCAS